MSNCKFCESLQTYKNIHALSQNRQTVEDLRIHGKYQAEYTAGFIVRSWYSKHGKRQASRTVDLKGRGVGYDLNFCPECGRKLNESEKKSPERT